MLCPGRVRERRNKSRKGREQRISPVLRSCLGLTVWLVQIWSYNTVKEKERKKRAGEPSLLPFIVNLVQPLIWMRFFVLFCSWMHSQPLESSSREWMQGGEVSTSLQVEQGVGSALHCSTSARPSLPITAFLPEQSDCWRQNVLMKGPSHHPVAQTFLTIGWAYGSSLAVVISYVLDRGLEEGGNRRQ